MSFKDILEGHIRFKEKFVEKEDQYHRLAEQGQHPSVLWIGCSDSRVIPEQISRAVPGEIFVVRNIANIVPPFDSAGTSVGAAVEYAMLHLKVRHVVICGHTLCGGIQALEADLDPGMEPMIINWIDHAMPARQRALSSGYEGERLYVETIKQNVLLQRENLFTYPCVQKRLESGELKVHGWLYDLYSGDILTFADASGSWNLLAPVVQG